MRGRGGRRGASVPYSTRNARRHTETEGEMQMEDMGGSNSSHSSPTKRPH